MISTEKDFDGSIYEDESENISSNDDEWMLSDSSTSSGGCSNRARRAIEILSEKKQLSKELLDFIE